MRIVASIFGILGVLAALFIVLQLARTQINTLNTTPIPAPAATASTPAPTVRAQSQNIQQNYQQAANQVMEQARRQMPDEAQ